MSSAPPLSIAVRRGTPPDWRFAAIPVGGMFAFGNVLYMRIKPTSGFSEQAMEAVVIGPAGPIAHNTVISAGSLVAFNPTCAVTPVTHMEVTLA